MVLGFKLVRASAAPASASVRLGLWHSKRTYVRSVDATRDRFAQIISFATSRVDKSWGERQEMEAICQTLQTARDDFDEKPMIMFVGAFSAGKSTLINSLLGKQVCATGIRPTTNDLHFHDWHDRLLVDSTGLDNWNKPEHKQKAFEAASRSNRAVVVTSGRQPIGEREIPILKQLVESQSKITVAINYWNHLETEEERSECMTYVQGCLKDIMPGLPVEVIPINAKSGSDPGVQQLSQFLLSTDDSDQKKVSAKAAMRIKAQQMFDMCAAHETKEKQIHEKKIEGLDREIQSLRTEVEYSGKLRVKDDPDLQKEEQELRELKDQYAKIWGHDSEETRLAKSIAMSTTQGAVTGSALGGPAGAAFGVAFGVPIGMSYGLFQVLLADQDRFKLNNQIGEKRGASRNLITRFGMP